METPSQPVNPIAPTTPPEPPPSKSKNFLPLIIVGITLLLAAAGGAYFLGTQNASTSPIIPTPQPTIESAKESNSTANAATTNDPAVIPSDWIAYTDTDTYFKIKTTLSLPPPYSFSFSGSEFIIQNPEGTELWDYSTSSFLGKNGIKNYYDGSSRREWYQRKLQGEFRDEIPETAKQEIIEVIERAIGSQTYLEVTIKNIVRSDDKHYLFVQSGIMHVIRPSTENAYSTDSPIAKNIGVIFASLSSSLLP